MAEPDIEIRKIKDVDLKGGIVLDGFPSIGLANTIASECLIHSLKTEFVGVLDSSAFPALSIIQNGAPNFPARIYANQSTKLAFFVSELSLDQSMYRPVANTMLRWAADTGCDLVISAAGIPYDDEAQAQPDQQVYAVASTEKALQRAKEAGIPHLATGSVAGIPAILLNEGAWKGRDVIVLLVRVLKDAPDFRAGAAVAEAVSRLAPGTSCNVDLLLKEAESMEKTLKKIRSDQAAGSVRRQMYG